MTAHTPGPWVFVHGALYQLVPTKRGPSTANVHRIALSTPQAEPGQRTPAGQNARLIAAAPELLEAAQALIRAWDDNGPLASEPDAVGMLRAAIARAEGEP